MKFRCLIQIALVVLCSFVPAVASLIHRSNSISGQSELVPNFMSSEFPFLNLMKSQAGGDWTSGGIKVFPYELDSNGYPIPGVGNWESNGGVNQNIFFPGQSVVSAHYVIHATGQGTISLTNLPITNVSCTGATSGASCNNAGCSSFTASSAGTILTVSSAPTGTGCTLGAGVPISGSGIAATKFGIPVFIISAGSSCGPNTCYTLSSTLNVASESMTMGLRYEVTFNSTSSTNSFSAAVQLTLKASQNGNPIQNLSIVQISDEAGYWAAAAPCGSGQGCIIGAMFKTRVQQGGWSVLRDLNWGLANVGNCSTWATRKPTNYFSYGSSEMRNAASGTTTYSAGGQVYTIPNPGQYIDAGANGASGGTVTYNAGTDIYSVTVNSGNLVDKQTFEVLIPATGTTSSKISMNGNTAVPILDISGSVLSSAPASGQIITYIFDQDLGGVLSTVQSGIACGIPPEVFIELVAELKMIPWHVLPYLALDPMTDWASQYATYLKSSYTPPSQPNILGPVFEVTNEPFNCATVSPIYLANKSRSHVSQDANHTWTSANFFCGASGNNPSEIGKMASTAGQDLISVYGTSVEVLIPVQTAGTPSVWNDEFASAAYIGQSMAAQTGYSKIAAYTKGTRVSINNYWNTGYYGGSGTPNAQAGVEVGLGYCYFNYSVSTACQSLYVSQQAVVDVKMNSSLTGGLANFNIPYVVNLYSAWNTSGQTCSQVSRPGNCTINATTPLMLYEGGYNETGRSVDVTQAVTAATNAASAVLTVTNINGCVAGQTVALSGLSGGTWAGAAGSYTVQAPGTDSGHCAINLNSTGLGTLSGATLTYTGSTNYVNYLRQSTYLQASLLTLTTTVYQDVIANGGINPSQFNLAGSFGVGTAGSWYVDNPNNWLTPGYPLATCASCTIAATSMTLGGTITGIFTAGMVVAGGSVTSNSVITACTPNGAGPCGSNATDVLTLSQSSTVAAGETITGTIPPATIIGGPGTISPVTAFKAICTWNRNAGGCSWLLKRDLDPASNDNDPMWLQKAA